MKNPLTYAAFFIAICALSAEAGGQIVYRCGAAYSQTPCPDAEVLNLKAPPSKMRKEEPNTNNQRDSAAAKDKEKTQIDEKTRRQTIKAVSKLLTAKKTTTEKHPDDSSTAGGTPKAQTAKTRQ